MGEPLWVLLQQDFGTHPTGLFGPLDQMNVSFDHGNTQFGLGPKGSGSSPHYHTHAYTSIFFGKKLWFFYPPPHQAMSQTHPMHLESQPEPGPKPLMCEQNAGDIIYVPMDWGHAVLNLELTAAIAREFFDASHESSFGGL